MFFSVIAFSVVTAVANDELADAGEAGCALQVAGHQEHGSASLQEHGSASLQEHGSASLQQTDANEEPPQTDANEEPPQTDDNEEPPQTDDNEEPPQTDATDQPLGYWGGSAASDENFQDQGIVYIRAANRAFYLHASGGIREGALTTLDACNKDKNYAHCQWTLEPSIHKPEWYIRALSETRLYIHAFQGNNNGAQNTLHPCPVTSDYNSCQWSFEKSPTRTQPQHYYIKSRNANLYLHVHRGISAGNHITLNPCPKWQDLENCQWTLEEACRDESPSDSCKLWASLGHCNEPATANMCKVTCGKCAKNSLTSAGLDQKSLVTVPLGEWRLVASQTIPRGGFLQYEIEEGITDENGVAVTKERAHSVGASIGYRMMFSAEASVGGVGVKTEQEITAEINTEHTWSSAREVSSSTSKSKNLKSIVNCEGAPEPDRSKVWLYQWVVVVGKDVAHTANTRCHYTDGTEHAPQCPFSACGKANEWCEKQKCLPWKAK